MNKRPLCVVLGLLVILILLFQDRLRKEPGVIYKGEQKTLQCQVEELGGQDGSFTVTAGDVMEDGVLLCRRMRLYAAENLSFPEDIKVGNILSITGKINSFSHPGNPGQFDEYQYYHDQGIFYRFTVHSVSILDHSYKKTEQWLCDLRSTLYQQIMACLPSEEGGVVAAMLLGEKCALTDEIRILYQENGIAHILAISGVKMLSLVSPYPLKKLVNWAFVGLHIAEIYIIFEDFLGQISPHCPSWGRGG